MKNTGSVNTGRYPMADGGELVISLDGTHGRLLHLTKTQITAPIGAERWVACAEIYQFFMGKWFINENHNVVLQLEIQPTSAYEACPRITEPVQVLKFQQLWYEALGGEEPDTSTDRYTNRFGGI